MKAREITIDVTKIEKWEDPYTIDAETKNEIIRMQKADDDEIAYGWFSFEGKYYPISRVVVCGKSTWFINGQPVMTVLEYEPCKITVQVKLGSGGEWGFGERRKGYQALVYNVMRLLGSNQRPCFNDSTDLYFNEMTSIVCNGVHPFDLIK